MNKLSMFALGVGAAALGIVAITKILRKKASNSKMFDDCEFDDYDCEFDNCECCNGDINVVIPAEDDEEVTETVAEEAPAVEEVADSEAVSETVEKDKTEE